MLSMEGPRAVCRTEESPRCFHTAAICHCWALRENGGRRMSSVRIDARFLGFGFEDNLERSPVRLLASSCRLQPSCLPLSPPQNPLEYELPCFRLHCFMIATPAWYAQVRHSTNPFLARQPPPGRPIPSYSPKLGICYRRDKAEHDPTQRSKCYQ